MKIKQQENVTCVSRGEFGLKSILRPSRQEEEDGGQVEEVQHVRAVEFRDQLSDELMDEEWKARMKSSRRLRDEEEVELLRFRGLHIEECPTLSADDAPQHVLPGEHSGSETQADGEADEEVSKGRGGAGEDLDVGLINVLPHRSMSFKQFKEQKAEQPPTEVNLAYMNHLHQHLVREIVFELSEEEVLHKREVMEEIKKSIERELERQRDPRKEGKQSLQIK
uniref:Uncharacterized protein n=1 Tax=Hanusia phi TaxID=3032 RepID=A0A7S0E5K6_9CRYP